MSLDGQELSDSRRTVSTAAINDDSPDLVELSRRYGLWNSARHFSWKRAIPEAQSDDRDALAVYWLELRDEAAKDGGAASTENTRPMCPNHHRARSTPDSWCGMGAGSSRRTAPRRWAGAPGSV